ncbi:MAG: hypothetical protein H6607_11040 [Flavobacteriales bacterium]|nr:hypothetical protein [Flavobacteriales bacterium]
MKNKLSFIFIFLLLFVAACREVEEPSSFGDEYFPLVSGAYWVYQIDSLVYDDFSGSQTTVSGQQKIHIVENSNENTSENRYYAEISYRKDSSSKWKYHRDIVFSKNEFRATIMDKNEETMLLLFPIKDRVSWDANQLNTKGEDRYRYIAKESWRSELFSSLKNPIFVEQEIDSSLIDADIRWEVYEQNKGLVEKRTISTETQFGKTKGFDSHWKLVEYVQP